MSCALDRGDRERLRGRRAGLGRALAALVALGLAAATATAAPVGPTVPASPSGGSAPPSAAPAPPGSLSPPSMEDVERMCAFLSSCEELPFAPSMLPPNLEACVGQMRQDLAAPSAIKYSLAIRECGLHARSCSEFRTCALRGAKPEGCVGRGRTTVAGICDLDGRALTCFHDQIQGVRDCPRGGEQCVVREGQATCALGTCGPEAKKEPHCSADGARILQCTGGALLSLDCGAFGLRCMTDEGAPGCAPATAACKGAGRCEGNRVVGCVHGHEVRVDCTAAGLVCGGAAAGGSGGAGAGAGASCLAPAAAGREPSRCNPGEPHEAWCAGSAVSYCAEGKRRTFLCNPVGFSRCIADNRGVRCGF